MPVRAVQTELRCKVCASPHRAAIDLLLERRSRGDKDESGRRFNFEYVKELVEAMGVENLTPENVKVHWKKHSEIISEEAQGNIEATRERMLAELPADASLDEKLAWATRLFEEQVLAAIEAGATPGITWDQYIKLLGIQNQRRQADAQNELFRSVGAGIAGAFAHLGGQRADVELDAEEAELAEIEA